MNILMSAIRLRIQLKDQPSPKSAKRQNPKAIRFVIYSQTKQDLSTLWTQRMKPKKKKKTILKLQGSKFRNKVAFFCSTNRLSRYLLGPSYLGRNSEARRTWYRFCQPCQRAKDHHMTYKFWLFFFFFIVLTYFQPQIQISCLSTLVRLDWWPMLTMALLRR